MLDTNTGLGYAGKADAVSAASPTDRLSSARQNLLESMLYLDKVVNKVAGCVPENANGTPQPPAPESVMGIVRYEADNVAQLANRISQLTARLEDSLR